MVDCRNDLSSRSDDKKLPSFKRRGAAASAAGWFDLGLGISDLGFQFAPSRAPRSQLPNSRSKIEPPRPRKASATPPLRRRGVFEGLLCTSWPPQDGVVVISKPNEGLIFIRNDKCVIFPGLHVVTGCDRIKT